MKSGFQLFLLVQIIFLTFSCSSVKTIPVKSTDKVLIAVNLEDKAHINILKLAHRFSISESNAPKGRTDRIINTIAPHLTDQTVMFGNANKSISKEELLAEAKKQGYQYSLYIHDGPQCSLTYCEKRGYDLEDKNSRMEDGSGILGYSLNPFLTSNIRYSIIDVQTGTILYNRELHTGFNVRNIDHKLYDSFEKFNEALYCLDKGSALDALREIKNKVMPIFNIEGEHKYLGIYDATFANKSMKECREKLDPSLLNDA